MKKYSFFVYAEHHCRVDKLRVLAEKTLSKREVKAFLAKNQEAIEYAAAYAPFRATAVAVMSGSGIYCQLWDDQNRFFPVES